MIEVLLFSFLAQEAPADPRIQLVELQVQKKSRVALAQTETLLDEDPDWSRQVGLEYLRGHLLDELDRPRAAAQAYVDAVSADPSLEASALLRIAVNHLRLGHPEVAASALATALQRKSSQQTTEAVTRLLVSSLAEGGDCRVLERVDPRRLPSRSRRRIAVAQIDCHMSAGRAETAQSSLLEILEEDDRDVPAKLAADRIVTIGREPSRDQLTQLGAVFHQHRDFDRAVLYLEPVVDGYGDRLSGAQYDHYYRLVRSYFWNDELDRAIEGFEALAARASRADDRAKALYQLGRSYEFLGRWQNASNSYRQAYLAEPLGDYSGAGLLSALRVEWRIGREASTADILKLLPSNRLWRSEHSRAMLFLTSSDLVRGRADRAEHWLTLAEQTGIDPIETAYWKGRLRELEGRSEDAVESYVDVLRRDVYHSLGLSALERLRSPRLAEATMIAVDRMLRSSRTRDLSVAWRILGNRHESASVARNRLGQRLAESRGGAAFLNLAAVPTSEWPLWGKPHEGPEDKLLALGLWREAQPVVLHHFPLSDVPLAYTASLNLAEAGHTHRSLYIAESLEQRVPDEFPHWLLPYDFRRLLYPLPYRDEIETAARRFEIDPNLLLAVLRQESRFDPGATSPASARGLGQFIYPTALRIARKIGRWPLGPDDLEDPSISIELSSAYLSELAGLFNGADHRMVAAYNAGERQSKLWQTYCYSWEPEEFLTKVSFSETRNYLERVLRNKAHYREIYGTNWASVQSP